MSAERPRGLPQNSARAIYGQILVTSIVAALSEDPEISCGYILVSVVTTMVVFWLAHVYAEASSRALESGEPTSGRELRSAMAGEWPLVQAAIPTSIVLALGAVGALSRDAAVGVAIGVGVAALFLWGLAIGRASSSSWAGVLLNAAVSSAFGLVILGLKALVH